MLRFRTRPTGFKAFSVVSHVCSLSFLTCSWWVLQNPQTRAQVDSLVAAGQHDELRSRLCSRMSFGTAGLRAPMGAGFNRINDLTVIQSTQVRPIEPGQWTTWVRYLPGVFPLGVCRVCVLTCSGISQTSAAEESSSVLIREDKKRVAAAVNGNQATKHTTLTSQHSLL